MNSLQVPEPLKDQRPVSPRTDTSKPKTATGTPGRPNFSKPILVSELPKFPFEDKDIKSKHYKTMMEWYSTVEDPDGKLSLHLCFRNDANLTEVHCVEESGPLQSRS